MVDIAEELPLAQRQTVPEGGTPGGAGGTGGTPGRELNLRWHKPWNTVHVQMPWISCQKRAPAEAPVLQLAREAWGVGRRGRPVVAAAAVAGGGGGGGIVEGGGAGTIGSSSSRGGGTLGLKGGVIKGRGAAAAGEGEGRELETESYFPVVTRGDVTSSSSSKIACGVAATASATTAAAAAGEVSGSGVTGGISGEGGAAASSRSSSGGGVGGAVDAEGVGSVGQLGSGPLLLFPDTSALLAMLGVPGVAQKTSFTMSILQVIVELPGAKFSSPLL